MMEKGWEGHEYSSAFQEECILAAKTSGKQKASLTVPAASKSVCIVVPSYKLKSFQEHFTPIPALGDNRLLLSSFLAWLPSGLL